MSTILDALRKAQTEQSPKQPQNSAGVVGSDTLLAPRPDRSALRKNQRAILLGCGGVLLLGITAWVLYGPKQKDHATRLAAEQRASATVTASPPQPPMPTPQTTPQTPDQQNQAPKAAPRRIVSEDEKRQQDTATVPAPQVTLPGRSTGPTVIQGTPEGIKLTGIAWHDTRKLRRVVLNDTLVSEGEQVTGVTVLEIRLHSVKIEKAGTVYEVSLP